MGHRSGGRRLVRRPRAAMIIAVAALMLSACGDDNDSAESRSTSTTTPTTEQTAERDLSALVPESLRSRGRLVVAMGQNFPPQYFIDNGELVGWNPDLARAVGEVLGLEVEVVGTVFREIIPGLESGRYDAAFASFTITPERLEVLDMIAYKSVSAGFMTRADDGPDIAETEDLCGKRVSAVAGSSYVDQLNTLTSECATAGNPEIEIFTFPNQSEAELAVDSGRADAVIAHQDTLIYRAEQFSGQFQLSDLLLSPDLSSVGVPKDSGLAPMIQAALEQLHEDGTYLRILKEWDSEDYAVDNFEINPDPGSW